MNILLTGAGGFVGARMKAALPDTLAAPSLRGASREDVRRLIAFRNDPSDESWIGGGK